MKQNKGKAMNKGSTLYLRLAVISIGLIVLALCLYAVPTGIKSDTTGNYRPLLFGLYIPAIPFYFALLQSMKLLDYIDKNKAFSKLSVTAIKKIKYCALIICGLFLAGMPYIYYVADQDDAPGVIVIGLVIVGASFAVATFAAVLQRILQDAMEIKAENELTV